ncbi:myotubularin-related protein 4-like isoform X2 [Halichondria panicea]|uniref:myotubularin-related protein 4-like isoform X2 n=1 Tax=Halichondria panicea TaxID=6063 RepID=UPI00312B538C
MTFALPRSFFSRMTSSSAAVVPDPDEGSFSHVLNRDLYKHRDKIVDDDSLKDQEPFPLLSGESIEYIACSHDDHVIAISNYRLFATLANGFYIVPLGLIECLEMQASKDSFSVVCKDARAFRLLFSSVLKCRSWFDRLQECKRLAHKDVKNVFAFIYRAYRKDQKLSRPWGESGDSGVANVTEPAESCEAGDMCEAGGVGGLLSLQSDSSSWRDEVMTSDYRRMGMCQAANGNETRAWRISECNDKYGVCLTYPKLLLVPGMISDEDLTTAAKFRMSGRLPVISWRHQSNGCVIARSSQPLVGVLGWRSPSDEKLLLAISQSCSLSISQSTDTVLENGYANGVSKSVSEESVDFMTESDEEGIPHFESEQQLEGLHKMMVFDLRSYTAALGNRAKGGGCECTDYYPNCEIFYKGLPNIHTVRKSFQQLRTTLISEDQTNYLSSMEGTQWLSYLCQLLSVASDVVGVVNNDHSPSPILVHCSDGWDRTTQIITLAEILLDPYYRTIKGFRVLVEREWVGFGHRFSDRCGHVTEDSNARSPIFLQWLDCVYQLLRQCPTDFQFNQSFLVKLGVHCFSCLYGTFLCNSMKEREEDRVGEDTYPVWSLLHEGNTEILNYLYKPGKSVLCPVTNIKHIALWTELYLSPCLVGYGTRRTLVYAPSPCVTRPQLIKRPTSQQTPSLGTPDNLSAEEGSRSTSGSIDSEGTSEVLESKPKPDLVIMEPESRTNPLQTQNTTNETSKETFPRSLPPEHVDVHPLSPTPGNQSPTPSNQTIVTETLITLDNQECGDSHEVLHGTHFDAIKNETGPKAIGNGHISPKDEETGSAKSSNSLSSTTSSLNSSKLSSSTPQNGLTLHSLSKACNGGMLLEAMDDLSPHVTQVNNVHTHPIRIAVSSKLGVDGLPLLAGDAQHRLRELVTEPQREVQRLRAHLKEIQLLVHKQGVAGGGVNLVEGAGGSGVSIEDQIASALDDQSPTSLSSWDCVDREEGVGVRWVPDHAVSHCQACGVEFWTGLRKHHCRSCGGVFCGSCSNFFCPVPHEQLFEETRVCEKCFYKLDGHLISRDCISVPPS